jgi:hypothetical protein
MNILNYKKNNIIYNTNNYIKKDSRFLGPDIGPKRIGFYAGPRDLAPDPGSKRNESWYKTQEHWILTADPMKLGLNTGATTNGYYMRAPKRIIIKIIMFIAQIIIFFILIIWIIIKIIIFFI